MGLDKAYLPFGPETLLQRVVRLLGSVAEPVVVVAAQDQRLPPLPSQVRVTRDRQDDHGPLEGIRGGLSALPEDVSACYVTSCDVPLLNPAVVPFLRERLADQDVVVPVDGRFHHPLAAIYRRELSGVIEQMLAEGQRRPRGLYDRVRTCRVPIDHLRAVDPRLDTLENLNRPEDYFAAVARAGWEVPPGIRRQLTR